MGYPKDELGVPPAVREDPRAFELARVWFAADAARVALRPEVWEDPAAWGVLLADLARHVAAAYHQADGRDPLLTLARVQAGFDAELRGE